MPLAEYLSEVRHIGLSSPFCPIIFYLPISNRGSTCAVEMALLDGVNPVPDSYFTASSEISNYGGWFAYLARLGATYNSWAPTSTEKDAVPLTCFLQVGEVQTL